MTDKNVTSGEGIRSSFLSQIFGDSAKSSANKRPVLEITADLLYSAHTAGKVKTFEVQALRRLDAALFALCRGDSLHDLEHIMEDGWNAQRFLGHMAVSSVNLLNEAGIDRGNFLWGQKEAVSDVFGLIFNLAKTTEIPESIIERSVSLFLGLTFGRVLSRSEILAVRMHFSLDALAPRSYVPTPDITAILEIIRSNHDSWLRGKKPNANSKYLQALVGSTGHRPVSIKQLARDTGKSPEVVRQGVNRHFGIFASDVHEGKWTKPSKEGLGGPPKNQ